MSRHQPSSQVRWDVWDMIRPVSHLAVTALAGQPSLGRGMSTPVPAGRDDADTGVLPGSSGVGYW